MYQYLAIKKNSDNFAGVAVEGFIMIGQISTSLLWICGKSRSSTLSRKNGHTILLTTWIICGGTDGRHVSVSAPQG
jgi:hypothetical protein